MKFKDLTYKDFPGVTSEEFEEWKILRYKTKRNALIAISIVLSFFIVISIILETIFLPGFFIFVLLSLTINNTYNKRSKALGINNRAIKKALKANNK